MAYDNELKGALFDNLYKAGDTHPDMTGSCQIDGVEYKIAAWQNESRAGDEYLSLQFTDMETVKAMSNKKKTKAKLRKKEKKILAENRPKGAFDDFDDDTPF